MKHLWFFLSLYVCTACIAQQKKALIIGIDAYEIPAGEVNENTGGRLVFPNLAGSKNDALAIQSVITTRFGFDSSNIHSLYDRDATRERILSAIDDLLESCSKNDIAFIYYAGHGSQVKNSSSKEADKKDETIVPSDTWKKGVADITDKELAKHFNLFVDKGVKLTVILDCCHSGSLARGIATEQPVFRFMPESDYDTKDPSEPTPPELRDGNNFLILSAAQSSELAQEQLDANRMNHGAFTIALLSALNQQPADAPASRIFSSLRAVLKSNGKKQEPVLGGSAERQNETLLGIGKDKLTMGETFQVLSARNGRVEFDAGYAQQILKDNELLYVGKNQQSGINDSVVVRIDTVLGISKSAGQVIKGNINSLMPGASFSLINWIAPKVPLLKIYIPTAAFTYTELQQWVELNKSLKTSGKVKWTNTLDKEDPETAVSFAGKNLMANTGGEKIEPVKDPSLNGLTKLANGGSFFFNLPPDKDLVNAVIDRFSRNKNMVIVDDPLDANYILYGTLNAANKPAYGLARAQIALRDSLDAMPLITSYITLSGAGEKQYAMIADSLYEYALRLSKVRGWLNLAGPKGGNVFPFFLTLQNDDTKEVYNAAPAKVGSNVSLYLEAEQTMSRPAIPSRYVYVFVIDKDAKMQLLYPEVAGGNVENRFPVYENGTMVNRVLLRSFSISDPIGTDSYFLIAAADPISNLSVFEQDGVRSATTRGVENANENPLASLLEMGNEPGTQSRGITKTSADWNLIKLQVKTAH